MFFLCMPNPVLWGVMAGLLHFIPFLGAMVGISVVTLVVAVTLDSLGAIPLVPATYLVLNLLEEYVVVPFVIGHRLLLNPVVLFVWLIFWGWLLGRAGRADGSTVVSDRQNRLRSRATAGVPRGIHRAVRLAALAFTAADQDHRADDQARRE